MAQTANFFNKSSKSYFRPYDSFGSSLQTNFMLLKWTNVALGKNRLPYESDPQALQQPRLGLERSKQ